MKTLLFLSFLMGLVCGSTSQDNLIPNPSFETVDCETDAGTNYFFGASHWYNCNYATPDYHGEESIDNCVKSIFSPSWTSIGEWQYPKDGTHMIGLFGRPQNSGSRDFIQCQLLDTLLSNHEYCFSMHVSLSNTTTVATDGFGAHFSVDSLLNFGTINDLGVEPQVSNPLGEFLTDTLDWMVIEGTYYAQGGERFLTIGNHLDNTECSYVLVNGTTQWLTAYYFVDDLELYDCTPVSVNELKEFEFNIYPNPVSNRINIESPIEVTIEIYNSMGQLAYNGLLGPGTNSVDLEHLSRGIYIVKLHDLKTDFQKTIVLE
jgi:hypothetical protein